MEPKTAASKLIRQYFPIVGNFDLARQCASKCIEINIDKLKFDIKGEESNVMLVTHYDEINNLNRLKSYLDRMTIHDYH